MTAHAPGPWTIDNVWSLVMHGSEEICAIHSSNKANAALIARAPDLLAENERLRAALNGLMPVIGSCLNDPLNPCWKPNRRQAPGTHWGGGKACVYCIARAELGGSS